MAEAGTFTITELQLIGGKLQPDFRGERFAWTSDRRPTELVGVGIFGQRSAVVRGGAHAIPIRPWTFGGRQRSVRTDYGGAKTPSEQVLGPSHVPFSLSGRWVDKFNFEGFAEQEMRRFEAMCARGNLCRFQFQAQAFIGLITDWRFDYMRSWDIGYEFTVSVHGRPDEYDVADRSPVTILSSKELIDTARVVKAAIDASIRDDTPYDFLASDQAAKAEARAGNIQGNLDKIEKQITQRERLPSVKPTDSFKKVATQFRTMGNEAFDMIEEMIEYRSDIELGVNTALAVLDFESWSRSLRFYGRVLMGQSSEAAAQMDERAEPSAVQLYRPHEGESLYAISQRFYNTPHSWRLIADRNGLTSFTLQGDEVLIIPERGAS